MTHDIAQYALHTLTYVALWKGIEYVLGAVRFRARTEERLKKLEGNAQ